jgi:histone-lysine N-methyltransferase SETMAR
LNKALHTNVPKFPASTSEQITSGTRKLNKLRQCIRKVRPNQYIKDVLLLHVNAWPHTSLLACEAITKMGWTVLPHPAHSPDLAPSDYHMFGPVKDALRGCHFADDNELKQSFRDVLRSRGREFSTDTESY